MPYDTAREAGSSLRSISFTAGAALRENAVQPRNVYLLQSGLFSTSITLADGVTMGVRLSAAGDLLGLDSLLEWPTRTNSSTALISGSALRISASHFRHVLRSSAGFQEALYAELGRRILELEQLTLCNRFHSLEQRLASLLLLIQRKTGESQLALTQALLAHELGVKRTSVVAAVAALRGKDLVNLRRASIVLDDVKGVERVACECYTVLQNWEAESARHRFALQHHLLA